MSSLSNEVNLHLIKVYLTLSFTILFAILGTLTNVFYHIGNIFSIFISLGLLFGLAVTPHNNKNNIIRLFYLFSFSFLNGSSINSVLNYAIEVDPWTPMIILSSTILIFTSFSLWALISKRRNFLFLGGLLFSLLNISILLGVLHIFVKSELLLDLRFHGGLILFCAFVVLDTQLIIEKAFSGNYDYIWHALELFLDFINLFIKMFTILIRRNKKRE
jgi:FtsH-binding integral membrane protein